MHLCEEYGTTHINGMCDAVKETSFVVVLGGGFVLRGGGWWENPTLGFWIGPTSHGQGMQQVQWMGGSTLHNVCWQRQCTVSCLRLWRP
jgi:hypothetical protein